MKIDNTTSSVTVSGVGHRIWREDFFPVVARILFAQYVKFADSQLNETHVSQCIPDVKNTETYACGIDPSSAVNIGHIGLQIQAPLTASKLAEDLPIFTSTPIMNRPEPHQDRINMQPALEIIKRLDQMDSDIKMFKQSIMSDLQLQIQDLKSSILNMVEKMKPERTYASVIGKPKQTPKDIVSQPQVRKPMKVSSREVGSENQSQDEGFCNISSNVSDSSQTLLKVVYSANNSEENTDESVGQPIPVVTTNRIQHSKEEVTPTNPNGRNRRQQRSFVAPTTSRSRILFIGDSILNGVNTKGLVKGIQKHSKGGATVQDLIEDVSVYDLRSFENCIIFVGGNDCARNTTDKAFIDSYEQLISLIKIANPECTIYVCKIAPRGDVDVAEFNSSIERLSQHWRNQNVHCISNTYDYFFNKNYLPASRYFSRDGIHMSHSGVKRLLDAVSTSITIVADYNLCVFSNYKTQSQRGQTGYGQRRRIQPNPYMGNRMRGGNGQSDKSHPSGPRRFRNSQKECYQCHMIGHIQTDCWNLP